MNVIIVIIIIHVIPIDSYNSHGFGWYHCYHYSYYISYGLFLSSHIITANNILTLKCSQIIIIFSHIILLVSMLSITSLLLSMLFHGMPHGQAPSRIWWKSSADTIHLNGFPWRNCAVEWRWSCGEKLIIFGLGICYISVYISVIYLVIYMFNSFIWWFLMIFVCFQVEYTPRSSFWKKYDFYRGYFLGTLSDRRSKEWRCLKCQGS